MFSGITIKLKKRTGWRDAQKMVSMARSLDKKLMIGCRTQTTCAIAAASQIDPACDWADLDGNVLIAAESDTYIGMEVINGKVTPREWAGIGIKPKK